MTTPLQEHPPTFVIDGHSIKFSYIMHDLPFHAAEIAWLCTKEVHYLDGHILPAVWIIRGYMMISMSEEVIRTTE